MESTVNYQLTNELDDNLTNYDINKPTNTVIIDHKLQFKSKQAEIDFMQKIVDFHDNNIYY